MLADLTLDKVILKEAAILAIASNPRATQVVSAAFA